MGVAGEGVLHQHGVLTVEFPPGLVRDTHLRQMAAKLEGHWSEVGELPPRNRIPFTPSAAGAHRSGLFRGPEAGVEVGQNVVDVLDTDCQPDKARGDTGGRLLLRRQLRVGGRCGVDDQ